jgi:hypothetical protein
MQAVAIGWEVYELTESAFNLGLIGLVQFMPPLFLMLLTGQAADRYNRRLILRGSRFAPPPAYSSAFRLRAARHKCRAGTFEQPAFAPALLVLSASVQDPPEPAKRPEVSWSSLLAGFRFIWRCKAVLDTMFFDLIATLLRGVNALLPI